MCANICVELYSALFPKFTNTADKQNKFKNFKKVYFFYKPFKNCFKFFTYL